MRNSKNSHQLLAVVAALFMTCLVPQITSAQTQFDQRMEVPSSINPVGSGARALGMGGAFIAIADDATAASWNPGGLIQLETPEISVVGAYFQRTEDNSFETNPEANGEQDVSSSNINYLSAAYPFTALNRNMIVSASYQYLFDLNRQWEFPLTLTDDDFEIDQDVEIDQEGSLSAIGIAYCVQMTPRISFGFTLNFWQDSLYDNKWKTETSQTGSGNYVGFDFTRNDKFTEEFEFSGFNANLGLLWNINHRLTLGLVLKTPFTADLTHKSTTETNLVFPDVPSASSSSSFSDETDEELDMPMSYGVGLAYRFSDKLTTSLDIYRTEWDNFILTDANDNEISPITGESADESDVEPTLQIRAGAEYLYVTNSCVIPFRGGVFYDPAPAAGEPDSFFGLSLGSGIAKGKIAFDLAYQYRFGRDVGKYIFQEAYDFTQDVKEHTIYASVIYHF